MDQEAESIKGSDDEEGSEEGEEPVLCGTFTTSKANDDASGDDELAATMERLEMVMKSLIILSSDAGTPSDLDLSNAESPLKLSRY